MKRQGLFLSKEKALAKELSPYVLNFRNKNVFLKYKRTLVLDGFASTFAKFSVELQADGQRKPVLRMGQGFHTALCELPSILFLGYIPKQQGVFIVLKADASTSPFVWSIRVPMQHRYVQSLSLFRTISMVGQYESIANGFVNSLPIAVVNLREKQRKSFVQLKELQSLEVGYNDLVTKKTAVPNILFWEEIDQISAV